MPAGGTAAVVVSWEGGAATRRCVESLLAQSAPPAQIVIVDNASGTAEREALQAQYASRSSVRLLLLDDNRHFAGGMNAGAAAAFADGARRVLLLNNDTVVEPQALARLEEVLDEAPQAGIVGPIVADQATVGRVISAGETHRLSLLCVPRSLIRPRAPTEGRPYRVSGVMGCALLVTRACFEAVGGFSEDIQVYYEDVDFCLGAQAKGYGIWIEPRAVIRHDGMRGFARGLTPWAATLKARNPWLVMRRQRGGVAWLSFVPTYLALIMASATGYLLRGRLDVAHALLRGAILGVRAGLGGQVTPVGSPREVG